MFEAAAACVRVCVCVCARACLSPFLHPSLPPCLSVCFARPFSLLPNNTAKVRERPAASLRMPAPMRLAAIHNTKLGMFCVFTCKPATSACQQPGGSHSTLVEPGPLLTFMALDRAGLCRCKKIDQSDQAGHCRPAPPDSPIVRPGKEICSMRANQLGVLTANQLGCPVLSASLRTTRPSALRRRTFPSASMRAFPGIKILQLESESWITSR